MIYAIIFLATILGLVLGSFMNVLTFRLISGSSIVMGRSQCQTCGFLLKARDLIPVVSFLWLLGKCRQCDNPISWQYPAVEMLTAVIFAVVTIVHLQAPTLVPLMLARDLVFAFGLIALFVFDYRWLVLPDQLTLPLCVLAILFNIGLGVNAVSLFAGAMVGGGLYFGLWAISRGAWVGSGDIRMGTMMGLMVGFPAIMFALYVSYLVGGVVALVLLLSGKKQHGSTLPMGTFLSIGTLATLIIQIIRPDYLMLFGF